MEQRAIADKEEAAEEQSIRDHKADVAPRVTAADVDEEIAVVEYFVLPGTTVTVCLLTLRNGFSVRGESACASPENFNRVVGEQIAYKDARSKIWALLGFRLRDYLSGITKPADIDSPIHDVVPRHERKSVFSEPMSSDTEQFLLSGVSIHTLILEVIDRLKKNGPSRENSLAITKAEELMMWHSSDVAKKVECATPAPQNRSALGPSLLMPAQRTSVDLDEKRPVDMSRIPPSFS